MQGLFKFLSQDYGRDAISDCAKNLKDIKRMKSTFPTENFTDKELMINLKA